MLSKSSLEWPSPASEQLDSNFEDWQRADSKAWQSIKFTGKGTKFTSDGTD